METNTNTHPAHASLELFDHVRSEQGDGVYASFGPNYYGAVFGRDSIEVAEDVILFDQQLPEEIIMTLCRLQGTKNDPKTEEEPGRIHHEHRSLDYANGHLPETSVNIFEELRDKWGGDKKEMTYYGSVDATPLFVRLVMRYIDTYGSEILNNNVVGGDGQQRTVLECVMNAVEWIERRIQSSPVGLVEYRRSNPLGIENQVWKDSETSYLLPDGHHAAANKGIAACEVQAYAFDALLSAAVLAPDADRRHELHVAAHNLQQATVEHMWLEDESIFAMGIDYDENNQPRPIPTPSSNAGLMLDSEILRDNVDQSIPRKIAETILSKEFLTPAGIRCRALSYRDLVDFPDYHGSYAVWPKETSDIARGLIKHGFTEDGEVLMQTMVDNINMYGKFYEFYYVNSDNEVIDPSDMAQAYALADDDEEALKMSTPEPWQAWTISAYLQATATLDQQ